jgi:hypothetical protein
MANEIINTNNSDDSGFGDRPETMRGETLKWTDQHGWHSPDGLAIPPVMMVISIAKLVRRFHPEYEEIRTPPLPNPDLLNAVMPQDEWEEDPNNPGTLAPPWKLNYEFQFLDPNTGNMFTYVNSTHGTRKCYQILHKVVYAARLLNGPKLLPMTKLASAMMPTRYGPRQRPHLEIVGYRVPAVENTSITPSPAPPQLPTPTIPQETAPAARPAWVSTPKPEPAAAVPAPAAPSWVPQAPPQP